jgi:hypothetical protein
METSGTRLVLRGGSAGRADAAEVDVVEAMAAAVVDGVGVGEVEGLKVEAVGVVDEDGRRTDDCNFQ